MLSTGAQFPFEEDLSPMYPLFNNRHKPIWYQVDVFVNEIHSTISSNSILPLFAQ